MKLVCCLAAFSCLPLIAQEEQKFSLESIHVNWSNEFLHHGNQSFNDYESRVQNQDFFIQDDSLLDREFRPDYYNYSSWQLQSSWNLTNPNWKLNLGLSYMNRIDRSYTLSKLDSYSIDTLQGVVLISNPPLYPDYPGVVSTFGVGTDTVVVDSVSFSNLIVNQRSQTLLVSAEFVRKLDYDRFSIRGGFGLGIGSFISSQVVADYRNDYAYSTTDLEYHVENEHWPQWNAEIPAFNPVQGDLNDNKWGEKYRGSWNTKPRFTLITKPYLTFDIEAAISKVGWLSHFAVVGGLDVGAELQLFNSGVDARFFWNYNVGLKYRI